MKNLKVITVIMLATIIINGCGTMNNATKGGLIGGAGGAVLGAGIGALAGQEKGAAIGAAIGGAVGAGAGVLIGHKMDKQKAELEKIEGAKVETVTDANNLKGIKVTFDNGILFATGKSELNTTSRTALLKFAESLKNTPETDITIYGHTDNTGTREFNVKLSLQRAVAVAGFLNTNGIEMKRMTTEGKAWDMPVADNSTIEGRAMNRRVEIYITANETMIKEAEQGNIK
jgi:outer membrane protein OmpA-like peptidoglycan-associated protein